jgi:4-amino-4-deoxy-L-arabinose transferase-like glycosyltransferase
MLPRLTGERVMEGVVRVRPTRSEWLWLGLILLGGLVARAAAVLILDRPLVSDSAAYMEMARTIVAPGPMRDIYGNAALYSPGYPFFLSALFQLFGIDPWIARAGNLLLGGISILLTWVLAREATGRSLVALLAAAGLAGLIPAIAGAAVLERENLSVPLLLLFLLLALKMLRSKYPGLLAAGTGAVFGCCLLAGVSILFTALVFVAAVAWRREGATQMAGQLFLFAAACGLLLAPWLMHVDREVGRPMMSTNGGINLYVGNNPAASGYFVSIADTPVGPGWEQLRRRLGEASLSSYLQSLAIEHALSDPARTILLDLRKLAYFWLPDTPDASDEDHGTAVTAIRWLGALQHVAILALALTALVRWRRVPKEAWLLVLAIAAFWSIHGIVYVITRYRAPAMPLVLILAALPVADAFGRGRRGWRMPEARRPSFS